jgi:hypothetical protein
LIVSRLEVDKLLRFRQTLNQLGHGGLGAQHLAKHLHCLERNTVSDAKQSGCQGEGKRDESNGMVQFMLSHHCLFYLFPIF